MQRYTYVYVYVCIYLSAYLTVCMRVCLYIRTHIEISMCTHMYRTYSSYAGIHIRSYIYIYMIDG